MLRGKKGVVQESKDLAALSALSAMRKTTSFRLGPPCLILVVINLRSTIPSPQLLDRVSRHPDSRGTKIQIDYKKTTTTPTTGLGFSRGCVLDRGVEVMVEEHDHVPKKVVPVACLGVLYHFNKATLDAKSLRSMKDAQSTKLKFYHTAEGATAAATERQALLGRARARRRNGSNGPSRVGEALRALFPLVFGKPRRRGREGHSQGKGGRSFQTQSRPQVSTIPLSVAFKLARRFPSYYEIACDEEERKAARRVVRERRGEAEATKLLDGGPDRRPSVPLFSVPGVR